MNRKIAGIVGAVAIFGSALGAAACSSSPSDLNLNGSASLGPNGPVVPLHATGSITDHGSINLNTNGRPAVIKLAKGDLIVQHSNSNRKTTGYDQSTGVMTAVETGTFKVVSGTGSYKGANGHGDFRINLTLKFAPGTSESTAQTSSLTVGPSGNPQSGVVVFHADGPVTP